MRDQFDISTNQFLPEPLMLGTRYKPIEPVIPLTDIPIARSAVAKLRETKQKFAAATEVRDYSNVGGVVQRLIGSGRRGGAATALIHFTGSKLPRGIISHSGLRPADSIEEINAAFKTASQTNFKGILDYTEDPIVSVDIIGNTNSCVFDAQLTSVIDKMVKVVGWYDNEIGYSSRIIDLILLLNKK